MARREFGPRQAIVEQALSRLKRLTRAEAVEVGSIYLELDTVQLEMLITAIKLDIVGSDRKTHWSNARAFASDAIRSAAYESDAVHYGQMGDQYQLPWGAARAAARDALAAIAVADILEPRNLDFLTSPLQSLGIDT